MSKLRHWRCKAPNSDQKGSGCGLEYICGATGQSGAADAERSLGIDPRTMADSSGPRAANPSKLRVPPASRELVRHDGGDFCRNSPTCGSFLPLPNLLKSDANRLAMVSPCPRHRPQVAAKA